MDPSGHEGLICSKKYGEHKKKEAEGGTLSEKDLILYQIIKGVIYK